MLLCLPAVSWLLCRNLRKKKKNSCRVVPYFQGFFSSNGLCYVLNPKGFRAIKNSFYTCTHMHRECIVGVKVYDVSNTEFRTL